MIDNVSPLDTSCSMFGKEVAVPVPVPTPVQTNICPTVFEYAPTSVKFVVPIDVIVYVVPTTKLPAVITSFCSKNKFSPIV